MEYAELTPTVTVLGISVEFGDSSVASVCVSLLCVGFPAPLGVGEFGGVTGGRSSVDPAPWVSTDPKRRFLGAVALRDRGRKLYPDKGDGRGLPRPRRIP